MILELSALLERSIEKSLEDRVAVSFSGGLDSTLIAAVAKKHAEVDLITAGTADCPDIEFSKRLAKDMQLPITLVQFDEAEAVRTFRETYDLLPMDLLKVEILVPVYKVAKIARDRGHSALLFGTGAEELFVGYERYFTYLDEGKDLDSILREEYKNLQQREISWIKRICRKFGIDARFPYYNKELADMMFAVQLEDRIADRELKKGLLREAATMLGTPILAVKRRKKAMQYGSGIHKMILKNSEILDKECPAMAPDSLNASS